MSLFVASTAICLAITKWNSLVKDSIAREDKVKIPKIDSEFSLGFERSKSVAKALNELGPMCGFGQQMYTGAQIVSLLGIALYGSYRVAKKWFKSVR